MQPDKRGDRLWVGGNHTLALDLGSTIQIAVIFSETSSPTYCSITTLHDCKAP
jgi:hypothetical protein